MSAAKSFAQSTADELRESIRSTRTSQRPAESTTTVPVFPALPSGHRQARPSLPDRLERQSTAQRRLSNRWSKRTTAAHRTGRSAPALADRRRQTPQEALREMASGAISKLISAAGAEWVSSPTDT